jgi:hypothetical protein
VDQPTLGVPDIFAVDGNYIPDVKGYPWCHGDVVGDKNGCAVAQANQELLMGQTLVVLPEQSHYFSFDSDYLFDGVRILGVDGLAIIDLKTVGRGINRYLSCA